MSLNAFLITLDTLAAVFSVVASIFNGYSIYGEKAAARLEGKSCSHCFVIAITCTEINLINL